MLKRGFTLIEVLIVITIIGILSIGIIVPYGLYSDIAKVKVSKQIIEQTITEARNSSAWLVNSIDGKNQNIGLFLTVWKNTLNIIGFPYNYTWPINESSSSGTLIREIKLENNVKINSIFDAASTEISNVTLYFRAPNWEMDIYRDEYSTWTLDKIIIGILENKTWVLSNEIIVK